MSLGEVLFFTDGACSGNPGPGGWAFIARIPHASATYKIIEKVGGLKHTTNNVMELEAACQCLEFFFHIADHKKFSKLRIFTDSIYVLKGATEWLQGWKRRGWKKADGKPVLNREYWERLDALMARVQIPLHWHHVEAHSGIPANERVDELAVAVSLSQHPHVFDGDEKSYPVKLMEKLPKH